MLSIARSIYVRTRTASLGGRRGHGLDLEDGLEQVLDDLGLALLAGLLDLLDPGVGLLVGLVLGLLVALVVLHEWESFPLATSGCCGTVTAVIWLPRTRTS